MMILEAAVCGVLELLCIIQGRVSVNIALPLWLIKTSHYNAIFNSTIIACLTYIQYFIGVVILQCAPFYH